jgi:hypothetical protein
MRFVNYIKRSFSGAAILLLVSSSLSFSAQDPPPEKAYPGNSIEFEDPNPEGVVKEFPVFVDDELVATITAPTTLWRITTPVGPEVHVAEVVARAHNGEESVRSEPLSFLMQATPPLDFNLSVNVLGACTLAAPGGTDVNFGDIVVGGSATRNVDVRNDGTGDCTVTGITVTSGSVFSVSAPTTFPVVVAPATTMTITVQAAGNAIGSHAATMSVEH